MIVNIQSKASTMGHWILLYAQDTKIIFFDSFGLTPDIYMGNISKYFNSFQRSIMATRTAIQDYNSYVCGAYCIYFAYFLCTGTPIHVIAQRFPPKKGLKNDSRVEDFVMGLAGNRSVCTRELCSALTFNRLCRKNCNC